MNKVHFGLELLKLSHVSCVRSKLRNQSVYDGEKKVVLQSLPSKILNSKPHACRGETKKERWNCKVSN